MAWPFAPRHQDVAEWRRQADDDRGRIHVRLMPAHLFCCVRVAVVRRGSCHKDGPSLLNVTAPFIDRSSGMWKLRCDRLL
jgi:hypothetical protein